MTRIMMGAVFRAVRNMRLYVSRRWIAVLSAILGLPTAKRDLQDEIDAAAKDEHLRRREMAWEPYKIAIAAFYALCIQRVFETTITELRSTHPRISMNIGAAEFDLGPDGWLIACQTLAIVIWIGLFYINNVRYYFFLQERYHYRRTLAHIALTVALGEFYFLAATVGRPGTNQVFLILSIVLIDTFFPFIIAPVLLRRVRIFWFGRGVLQSSFVLLVLLVVPVGEYSHLGWSVALLSVMLAQLLILAPVGGFVLRRLRAYDQSP